MTFGKSLELCHKAGFKKYRKRDEITERRKSGFDTRSEKGADGGQCPGFITAMYSPVRNAITHSM